MLMKEARLFLRFVVGTLCATSFYLYASGLATPRAGLSSSSSSSALRYNHLAQPSQVQAFAQPSRAAVGVAYSPYRGDAKEISQLACTAYRLS